MTDAAPLDINHLRTWIGRKMIARDVVALQTVLNFQATFDLPQTDTGADVRVPPLLHFCLAQSPTRTSELGEDGHPQRGGFLPPIPLPRRMWAGGDIRFVRPLHAGQEVERISTLRDIEFKSGRSGALCFVTVEHRLLADGQLAIVERQDIVYRDAAKAVAPAAEINHGARTRENPPHRSIAPTESLLFRYSALTFNSHRIHYDRAYAMSAEGYPGLVVHGPLQATLLALLAEEMQGAPLSRFTFRSISPLFDNNPIGLQCKADESGLDLWSTGPGSLVATRAKAEFL
jgi:3-methylfumaryl-CoA hydratase